MTTPQDLGLLDLEMILLSACIPKPELGSVSPLAEKESLLNLDNLITKVLPDQWSPTAKSMLNAMVEYRTMTDGLLTEDALIDMLTRAGAPADIKVKYQDLFVKLREQDPGAAKFKYSMIKLQEEWTEKQYVNILNDAYTVYQSGVTKGKEIVKGYLASREMLNSKLFELDVNVSSAETVEGDVRDNVDTIRRRMKEAKDNPASVAGIMTGFQPIDEATNGGKAGELWVVGAYTGEGKSYWMDNVAYNASVIQGKNVAIFDAEMLFEQRLQRLVVRHSRQPKFGLPHGISASALERGQLTPQEEENFEKVLDDLVNNPSYGRMHLHQVSQRIGVTGIAAKCNMLRSRHPLHLIVLDYLRVMVEENDNSRADLALNQAIRDAKQLALGFDKGKGIWVITGWQTNRKKYETAMEKKMYDKTLGAEAGELEKSADVLTWLLRLEGMSDKHEILGGVAKIRKAKTPTTQFVYFEDFDASYLGIANSSMVSAPTGQGGAAVPNMASISGLI